MSDLSARADVATPTPERYLKQLAAHLGHRIEVQEAADGTRTFPIGTGRGVARAEQDRIVLEAHATDPETLERIKDVLGRHLARFGQRQELVVTWV